MMGAEAVKKGDLAGQVAIVTGGRGVARATALALAEAGAAVMVTARSIDEIEETASVINAAGGRAVACPADVTDLDAVKNMLAVTEEKLGPPTLLFNVAGGGVPGSSGKFETLVPEQIIASINLNLLSAMLLSRLVLPGMLERKQGRIISISSGAAMCGMPFLAPYCVSKTAIARFSEVLALELQGRGVSSFAVTPGNVLTKLTEGMYPARHQLIANPPEGFPWKFPAGHAMEDEGWYPPERAAELCVFLASGKADALSGRFFSVHYDEAEMVAQTDRIKREDLYTLQIPTLDGLEQAHYYFGTSKKD